MNRRDRTYDISEYTPIEVVIGTVMGILVTFLMLYFWIEYQNKIEFII